MNHKNIKIFIALLVSLFIFPATVTDVLYRDDAYRLSISGGYWWWMGRPFADVVAWITSNSTSTIINSHPAGLIFSTIAFVGILFFIIDKKLISNENYALAPLPFLMISPFFIQNIAYQYDAPGMILGLSLSILSFFILSLKNNYSYAVSFVLLFLSLCLYQPTANIFLGLSAANLLLQVSNNNKGKFKQLVEECLVFSVTYVLYYVFIIKLLSLSGASRGNIIPLGKLHESIYNTIVQLLNFTIPLLNKITIIQFILCVIIIIAALILHIKHNMYSIKNIVTSVCYALIAIVMVVFSVIGVSFIVPEGIAGARVLVGFGVVYYIIAASVIKSVNGSKAYIIVSVLVMPTLVLSYQFFKYSTEQRRFEYTVLSNVINATESYDRVYMIGDMRASIPVSKAMASNMALRLLLSPAQPWVYKRLAYTIGAINVEQGWNDKPEVAKEIAKGGAIVSDGRYYRVIINGNSAVVEMK